KPASDLESASSPYTTKSSPEVSSELLGIAPMVVSPTCAPSCLRPSRGFRVNSPSVERAPDGLQGRAQPGLASFALGRNDLHDFLIFVRIESNCLRHSLFHRLFG